MELMAEDFGTGLLALCGHRVEALVGRLSEQPALPLARAIGQHLVLARHACAVVQVCLVALDVGVVSLPWVGAILTVVVCVIAT